MSRILVRSAKSWHPNGVGLDGKRKARPPVALIAVVGVEVKGASRESA